MLLGGSLDESSDDATSEDPREGWRDWSCWVDKAIPIRSARRTPSVGCCLGMGRGRQATRVVYLRRVCGAFPWDQGSFATCSLYGLLQWIFQKNIVEKLAFPNACVFWPNICTSTAERPEGAGVQARTRFGTKQHDFGTSGTLDTKANTIHIPESCKGVKPLHLNPYAFRARNKASVGTSK